MPTRDALQEILRTRAGELSETPYAHLLLALAVNERTATLELRKTPLEKSILFDAGSPVECRSNIATETLGRFLVAQGKITDEDARNALSAAAARGVPLGELLVERKLLTPTDLYRNLQQNLGRKLLEPFSWTSGTWEISYDAPAANSALRVKTPQLIVTGVLKVLPQELADAAAPASGYLSLAREPYFSLDDVRLTSEQQQVIEAAREAASVEDIRKKAADDDDLNRLLYALTLLGIINITAERVVEEVPVVVLEDFEDIAVSAPQTPPAQPTPSSFEIRNSTFEIQSPPSRAANVEEVMSNWLSYRRKDSFELLNVEEWSDPPAITKSYIDLAEKFAPWSFENDTIDRLRDKAQEVYLALARAYAEMADAERRNALLARRAMLRDEATKAAGRGRAALLDPEEMLKSGRALYAAGKLREALGSFEMAAQCDAQNGTYAAEAAWTRFRLNATPATNALKLLKNAIRIDPKAGVAYLYAGQLLAILGQKVEAAGYLGRAERLLPGDKRVAEAVRAAG